MISYDATSGKSLKGILLGLSRTVKYIKADTNDRSMYKIRIPHRKLTSSQRNKLIKYRKKSQLIPLFSRGRLWHWSKSKDLKRELKFSPNQHEKSTYDPRQRHALDMLLRYSLFILRLPRCPFGYDQWLFKSFFLFFFHFFFFFSYETGKSTTGLPNSQFEGSIKYFWFTYAYRVGSDHLKCAVLC